MNFNPAEHRNLGHYTEAGLRDLHRQVTERYNEVFAAANADDQANLTQAHIDELRVLREFRANVSTQLATFAVDSASLEHTADEDTTPPSVGDIAGQPQDTPSEANTSDRAYLVASAGSGRAESGQRITLAEAATILRDRVEGLAGVDGHGASPVFSIRRPTNPELTLQGNSGDMGILDRAADTSELRARIDLLKGLDLASMSVEELSRTASAGWCAVSETDYGIRTSYAVDGLMDVPRVNASRGGLRWYPELMFATVFGGHTGTNFFNLTEAQVIAGATKTFVEVGCPDITELRLGVSGLGVITNLLAVRGLPEYTNKFISGALTAFEYYQNMLNVAAVVAGSVPVNISAAWPWVSDGSVFSVVYPAVEMAATDIRTSKMLPMDAIIEVKFPVWLQAQIRADLARRAGMVEWVADAWIMAQFAKINVSVQFIRNYQDAWTAAGDTGLGATARLTSLPTTLYFLAYPAGTWVRLEEDVIRVSTVYDAVRLAANQRMELFMETGWRMMPRLTGSYEYQVDICPSGSVGAATDIVCAEPQE